MEVSSGDSDRGEIEREELSETIVNDLLDEVALGLCFEIHRSCKLGTFLLDEMDAESQKLYEIVNDKGVDVFGQVPTTKKQYDCLCPNCHRNLAASRFAPHLEKCMGMGGNMPRVASRRLANSSKKCSDIESDDNSHDNDWTYHSDRKAKKIKKDKRNTTSKKTKLLPKSVTGKSICNVMVTETSPSMVDSYVTMTFDEKKSLLNRNCGVISEHTKKMCTRSINCPQHTDDQRRIVREYLFQDVFSNDDGEDVEVTTIDDESSFRDQPPITDLEAGSLPIHSNFSVRKKSKLLKKHSTGSSSSASRDNYHMSPD